MLNKLLHSFKLCRQLGAQVRISQAELILTVAAKPGLTQTQLSRECNLTLAAVSRAVDVLGKTGRRGGGSTGKLGFIEARKDPNDDRHLLVYLTPAGEQFVSLLMEITYGSHMEGREKDLESPGTD